MKRAAIVLTLASLTLNLLGCDFGQSTLETTSANLASSTYDMCMDECLLEHERPDGRGRTNNTLFCTCNDLCANLKSGPADDEICYDHCLVSVGNPAGGSEWCIDLCYPGHKQPIGTATSMSLAE